MIRATFAAAIVLTGTCAQADVDRATAGAESRDQVFEHFRKIPQDDIWWTVRGEEMAWLHKNVQQRFPTAPVYRSGAVSELEHAPLDSVANYPVPTPDGHMPFRSFLDSKHSAALGVVILHKGKLVFEHYPRMQPYEKPIYWSVSKVFAGAVIRILEEQGKIDVSKNVSAYLDELSGTPFGETRIRNVLDHATGLDCGDEYDDRNSCYYQYSMAIGDGFREENAPDNPYDFLKQLKVKRLYEQGTHFSYSGTNNFVLMWLAEEITGRKFNDIFSDTFWRRIGAEGDAAFIAYRYGIPLSHGGFLSNLRDLARFGLLYTPSFRVVSTERVISEEHLAFMRDAGRPELFANIGVPVAGSANAPEPAIRHNIYQWGAVYTNGAMAHGGWGGQGLIVNPVNDTVAVFAAYFKEDGSEIDLEPIVLELLNKVFPAAAQ